MNLVTTKKIYHSQSKVKRIMIFAHDKDGCSGGDQTKYRDHAGLQAARHGKKMTLGHR